MILVVLIALTPHFAVSESHWIKGITCGLALTGAVYGSLIHRDYQSEPWGTDKKANVENLNYTNFQKGIYALSMGPTKSLLFKTELRISGKSEYESLIHSLNILGVYTLVLFGLKGLQRSFFVTPIDKFLNKTNQQLLPNPKKVLFLDMIGDTNRLTGYPEAIFTKLYEKHDDAQFISFKTQNELRDKLLKLEGQSFDRIEFVGHAAPGKIEDITTSEGVISISAMTDTIAQLPFSLTHSKSEIRMIACSVLNGLKVDSDFHSTTLGTFVKAILPFGGTFVGGSKNIMMFEIVPNANGFAKNEGLWLDGGMVFLAYMLNAESIRTIFSSLFSLKRDYLDSLKDIKVFKLDESGRIQILDN